MSDVIVNITPPAPIELLYSQGGAVGPQGQTGSVGPVGPTNRLVVGTVTSGTAASATISAQTVANGTATQTLNLVLPQGETGSQGIQGVAGPAGPVNVLSVGSVETTSATTASISITGTAPSQVISFVVPRGPQGIQGEVGPFMNVQVGGVTTGASGTNAKVETVTAGGTVTLNFTIPRGADATANLADETPQPLGIASVGSALKAARADHVHSVPAISFGSLTGVPLTFSPSAHTHAVSDVANLQAALDSKQPAGSYATLVNGAVPSSMLPGFVDDIIEYATLSAFPATNDVGKIYTAIDTRKIYRWSGTGYVEISPSPGTTTDVPEGTNLYHTTARAAAAAPVQSVSGRTGAISLTKSDVGLDNVPNTDATARANHTGTQTAATISDFATEAAKYGPVTSVSGRTGVITLAQLGSSGTASASTFLRGDGQWAAAGSTDASALNSGTVASARLPLATTTAAGAVIVGSGLTIANGVVSVDSPLPAPASVYYNDGVRWTPVTNAATYEISYTTDSGASYTHLGTLNAVPGNPQGLAQTNYNGLWKFRVRAVNSSGVAGEWGYESGLMPPGGGGGSYSLPTASSSVLGGIKVGSGLTITDGVLAATGGGGSANIVEAATAAGFPAVGSVGTLYHATDVRRIFFWDVSGVYVEAGTSGGGGSGSSFTLTAATASELGGIKVGSGLTIGDGVLSATGDSVLRALFVPGAPTSVTATAGDAQATVSWTAPAVLSQTPITGYVVEWTPSGGSASTVSTGSTSTSYTKTALANGTSVTFRVAAVNALGQGAWSTASSAATPTAPGVIDYLVIAGGGGGGYNHGGGGGGAGGYLEAASVTVNSGQAYTVIVGGGAPPAPITEGIGASGGNSSFLAALAYGGGSGARSGFAAGNGGSGGGSSGNYIDGEGSGVSGQGYAGAKGSPANYWNESLRGGGGGGAGAAAPTLANGASGHGGAGRSSSITGSAVYRAGGGGGSSQQGVAAGSGGSGGGGDGNSAQWGYGGSGGVNTGSGGGGGGGNGSYSEFGGTGGSGVVIIRTLAAAAATTGSPTVTTSGSYTIYTFTGSGSITF